MNGADSGHDFGGVEDPDSGELGQGGSGCFDGSCDVAGGFGDATVECADLGDEVSGQAAQRLRATSRDRIWRRMSAARSAVRPRAAPDGVRWVSRTCNRLNGLSARLDQVPAVFHHGAQGGDGRVDRSSVKPSGSPPTFSGSAPRVFVASEQRRWFRRFRA